MVVQKRMSSKYNIFDELEKKILYLDADHKAIVKQAFEVAYKAHSKQRRKTGELYITHPLAVAGILAELKMDHQTLVAALLHDTIEDTYMTKSDIIEAFDLDVAMLVDGVSKLKHIKFNTKMEAQAEYLRKMLLAMSKDIRVILVKLADRLHNMRTISAMESSKRVKIAKETLDIYAPIARRLGMISICLELENLGFKTLNPLRYSVLKLAVQSSSGRQINYLQEIISQINLKFDERNFNIISMSAREKHLYSIYKKMRRKNISFADVNDVYGVRVIVDTKESCYLALCYIHEVFKPMSGRIKDYIAMPKPNGYQSLHTVLFGPNGSPIEVQIRTKQMSDETRVGLCSHWIYKNKRGNINKHELHAQQWIRSIIELQQQTGDSADFLENVKINLVPDEVYVFTPKGEIVELPSGSTIIDMAYAIHTEIGNTCVAAKVDRQLMPLSTQLVSGVTVEIITSPTAFPSISYLGFVVTPKAKNSIRAYFKNKKRDQASLLGLRLLEAALLHPISDYEEALQLSVAKKLGCQTIKDMLINIGLGCLNLNLALEQFNLLGNESDAVAANDVGALPISGAEGLVLEYATCCYPIPGDEIAGFMLKDQGVILHKKDCAKVKNYSSESEVIVYWSGMVVGEFKVRIEIIAENKQGLLATIALAIAEHKSSIEDVKIVPSSTSTITVQMVVMVTGRNHLADIFKRLKAIKHIYRVKRK